MGEPSTDAVSDEAADDIAASLAQLADLVPAAIGALERNLTSGQPEVEVHAAEVILRSLSGPAGAAYSFKGHISNRTDLTLTLKSKERNGSWVTEPPATIGAGGTGDWQTTYDGFNHTGKVIYEATDSEGELVMSWAIPLFGNNTIKTSVTISGMSTWYQGGRGWHAEVWYYLETAS